MIHTLTLNPALDHTVRAESFTLGVTNRAEEEKLTVGGKGINVSLMLSSLGVESIAHGFLGGEIGVLIEQKARSAGLVTKFIFTAGESRINCKIKSNEETELNGKGVTVTPEAYAELLKNLSSLQAGDFLVLAGSVPQGLTKTVYAELMQALKGKGIRFVVDTTGEALRSALPHRPFLVKPNAAELGELFGVEITEKERAVFYAKKLLELGAERVLVSLGGEGAVFVSETGEEYQTAAPQGKVVDTVGSGDSVVAGFLWSFTQGRDERTAFLTGVAAGSASAFTDGFATKTEVENLLKTL